jgi:hypothetical protein
MSVKGYAEELQENGLVVVEDFIDEEKCDELYDEISTTIEDGDIDAVEGGEDDFDYEDLANWGGPVMKMRTGRDKGMIDVFNIDERIPAVGDFKTDKFVREIISESKSEDYSPDNVNVYWNRSVTGTRDFHADTYSGKFKSFVYLTDVPDRSYGPFSYVKRTHESSQIKQTVSGLVNRVKGDRYTDAVFYDESDVTYCTAPKGTLIIADQTGYHRGHPQEEGRERMLMTTSYTPVE